MNVVRRYLRNKYFLIGHVLILAFEQYKQIGRDQVYQPVRERCPAKGVWRVEVKDKEVAGGFALRGGAVVVWDCLGGRFKTRRGIWFFLGRRTAREIELCEFQQQTGVERSLRRN